MIQLSQTGRGRLIDVPGSGKCAIKDCEEKAAYAIMVMSENVNLSASRSGATDWGGGGTRGYLCPHHKVELAEV